MQQFLELFHPLPGSKYLIVTTHADVIAKVLAEKMLYVEGMLWLECYPGEHEIIDGNHVKRHDIAHFKAPFRALPREYDMVIFQDIYSQHNYPERLLKLAYTTLANTAHLIIMEPKGTLDIPTLLQDLERMEYRAANAIDLLDDYDLVMAKKMHMWGNGL
jgi:hypothetical protein